jgi:hypothetical protein
MLCDHFRCGVGRVEGVAVDRSRNDGGMGRDGEKKRRKGESVSISHPTDVANISPHRMYEMYMLGNICFF